MLTMFFNLSIFFLVFLQQSYYVIGPSTLFSFMNDLHSSLKLCNVTTKQLENYFFCDDLFFYYISQCSTLKT